MGFEMYKNVTFYDILKCDNYLQYWEYKHLFCQYDFHQDLQVTKYLYLFFSVFYRIYSTKGIYSMFGGSSGITYFTVHLYRFLRTVTASSLCVNIRNVLFYTFKTAVLHTCLLSSSCKFITINILIIIFYRITDKL